MKLLLLIAILAFLATLSLFVVIALYRHKKSSKGIVKLIGEIAEANTALDPEGSVIVHGELWPARSRSGTTFPRSTRLRIVAAEDHLLLVESFEK